MFIWGPTWSKEETEELLDLLRLPSFPPSSPLLPVTAFARDFGAVGVFTCATGHFMCKRILRPLELCGVRVGRTDHTSYFGLLGGWRGLFHILIFPLLLLASVLLLLLGPGTHLAVIPKIHLGWWRSEENLFVDESPLFIRNCKMRVEEYFDKNLIRCERRYLRRSLL